MNKYKKFIIFAVVLAITSSMLVMGVSAAEEDSGGLGDFLLSGLKSLFIPDSDYFERFQADIMTKFNKKFGGVTSAVDYLKVRFQSLRAKNDLQDTFKVTFPKGSFLSGLSVNFLSFAAPVLSFVRFCVTGFCCLMTALICYRSVIDMINT